MSTVGKFKQRNAPRGAISSPQGLTQSRNKEHWLQSKNVNNAGLVPPVNSCFNHPTGVHLVVEASLRGLASLVISEAMRRRQLEPDSLPSSITKGDEEYVVTICFMPSPSILYIETSAVSTKPATNVIGILFPTNSSFYATASQFVCC